MTAAQVLGCPEHTDTQLHEPMYPLGSCTECSKHTCACCAAAAAPTGSAGTTPDCSHLPALPDKAVKAVAAINAGGPALCDYWQGDNKDAPGRQGVLCCQPCLPVDVEVWFSTLWPNLAGAGGC